MRALLLSIVVLALFSNSAASQARDKALRVFIFAGQSNMVGSDSIVRDIERFPPFAGLGEPQKKVRFHYCIGREEKHTSDGWVDLAPVDDVVGPELSFARKVSANVKAPIAIIKIAAGGTHLGGDWNPDEPSGFELYPLALRRVREALADLDSKKVKYRLEGFMWHQGENDMFDDGYKTNYGKNLANFMACWRRDLVAPELRFYVGELCTKTIWGMDLRSPMYAISVGQRAATDADEFAQYVRNSHIGVEIGHPVGLHYHYGTLGQLQHGECYADAYLTNVAALPVKERPLRRWPYKEGSRVKLFVVAGHRNVEGERAFVDELATVRGAKSLAKDDPKVAFRYSLGGGYRVSDGWEPLGPTGFNDTFGPELSLAKALKKSRPRESIAIAKFTHGGSQIIDWTPSGSEAVTRNLYPSFIAFVQASVDDLVAKGHSVDLAGIFYHLGENDMSWMPFRRGSAERLGSFVTQSRKDLNAPELPWFVSQQEPTSAEGLDEFDVVAAVEAVAANDPWLVHFKTFELPGRERPLVLSTPGVVALGERWAGAYLAR